MYPHVRREDIRVMILPPDGTSRFLHDSCRSSVYSFALEAGPQIEVALAFLLILRRQILAVADLSRPLAQIAQHFLMPGDIPRPQGLPLRQAVFRLLQPS